MSEAIDDYLTADHRRLDRLLASTLAAGALDLRAYAEFRGGLLRHIGMEEKILLPAAARVDPDRLSSAAGILRRDHGALAALLVPTPTRAIVEKIRELLAVHDLVEEGPGGVYDLCTRVVGDERGAILQRLRAAPAVPLARHFDGARAFEAIERLLRAAGEARGDAELFLR